MNIEITFVIDLKYIDDEEATVNRIYESGLDDATVMTRRGKMIITVDREAKNYRTALAACWKNFESADIPIKYMTML